MQWAEAPNAGFSPASVKPWLAVNPNFPEINAAREESDPDSVLRYTQKAIALHHDHLALVYGNYRDLDPSHPQVFAYTRTITHVPDKPDERFLVVLNFSPRPVEYTLPTGVAAGKLLLANIPGTAEDGGTTLKLEPWDARVYTF